MKSVKAWMVATAMVVAVIMLAMAGAAGAERFGFRVGDKVIVSAGDPSCRLNYRAGTGVDHTVLRSYPDGTKATVMEVSPKGLWFRCLVEGRQDGWFWGGYLRKDAAAAVTGKGEQKTVANYGMFVNLRVEPDGAVLARVPDGAKVTVYGSADGWSRVGYGGMAGYVMSHFLK